MVGCVTNYSVFPLMADERHSTPKLTKVIQIIECHDGNFDPVVAVANNEWFHPKLALPPKVA